GSAAGSAGAVAVMVAKSPGGGLLASRGKLSLGVPGSQSSSFSSTKGDTYAQTSQLGYTSANSQSSSWTLYESGSLQSGLYSNPTWNLTCVTDFSGASSSYSGQQTSTASNSASSSYTSSSSSTTVYTGVSNVGSTGSNASMMGPSSSAVGTTT